MHGLDASHEHLSGDYSRLLSNAFGRDENAWSAASPARFDPAAISERVRRSEAPRLILLDESIEDQLVPMSQRQSLKANLIKVAGLDVVAGHRAPESTRHLGNKAS